MGNIKPLRRFGQNFLNDKNIIQKIFKEIDPKLKDHIIEVGPGLGILTKELYHKTKNLIAVEIDKRVIKTLSELFPDLFLLNDDFLNLDLNSLCKNSSEKLRICGNIPYNLTSPIVFKLIENNQIIEDAVFMVQYEVAKRMTAPKGTKDYGILSVILNYFAEVKLCFKVSPNVFYPKPKVHSAVVHILFKNDLKDKLFNEIFIKIVKASFGNRRKTIKNSLNNSIFSELDFENSGIDLSLRAEQLEMNDFIRLTKFTQKELNGSKD